MGQWVKMAEAAHLLGVSEDTVRRRIREGELPSRQEKTPRGFRWLVELAGDETPESATAATPASNGDAPAVTTAPTLEYVLSELGNLRGFVEDLATRPLAAPEPASLDVQGLRTQLATLEDAVRDLRADKEWFKNQADIRAREVEQLHILLQRAAETRAQPLLIPPHPRPAAPVSTTAALFSDIRRSRWWRWITS